MCSSTELIFNSRRISLLLFLSNFVYPAVLLRNLISLAVILVPYVKIGLARVIDFNLCVCFWTKGGLNICLMIPMALL
jgi:hypothetical protein